MVQERGDKNGHFAPVCRTRAQKVGPPFRLSRPDIFNTVSIGGGGQPAVSRQLLANLQICALKHSDYRQPVF